MSFRIFNGSSGWLWLVGALALTSVLALGLAPLWLSRPASNEAGPGGAAGRLPEAEKPERDLSVAEAMDQWRQQTEAAYLDGLLSRWCLEAPPPLARTRPLKDLKLLASSSSREAWAAFAGRDGRSEILRPGDPIGLDQGRLVAIAGSAVMIEEPGKKPGDPPRLTVMIRTFPPPDPASAALTGEVALYPEAAEIQPERPEQAPIFQALNQMMRQTMADYHYDPEKIHDPFFPMKDIFRRTRQSPVSPMDDIFRRMINEPAFPAGDLIEWNGPWPAG